MDIPVFLDSSSSWSSSNSRVRRHVRRSKANFKK